MKRFSLLAAVVLMSLLGLLRCEPSAPLQASFAYDIQPVLITQCSDCHAPGGSANLDFSSYETMLNGHNDNPPLLIPYEPENSLLMEKIARAYPSIGSRMPMGRDPLSYAQIQIFDAWIEGGAHNN